MVCQNQDAYNRLEPPEYYVILIMQSNEIININRGNNIHVLTGN